LLARRKQIFRVETENGEPLEGRGKQAEKSFKSVVSFPWGKE